MKIEIICHDTGMNWDTKPALCDTLIYWKNRQCKQPVTPENLQEFAALPGTMYFYPWNPEFGLSKLDQCSTPLYTNGQMKVKEIKIIN
jgi:hypothetical protein